ncbi:MAG TPA: hypothetical protein VFD46_01925, partial [Chryseolinea sp.]|nr:hypothetical protein [Chryseolinea sp.]
MELSASKNETTGRWTLEGVEPSEKTFDRICQMLRDKVNFKFARYGDGEFLCMSGKIGRNCDKHEYFPDLGLALNDAFYSDPQYMVGIQPLSVQGGLYQRAVEFNAGPKNIYDADVLHSASIDGKINQFISVLKMRDVVIVGPAHLLKIGFRLIKINDTNCWDDYEDVCELISYKLKISDNPVFLLCASMMSEVIINCFSNS